LQYAHFSRDEVALKGFALKFKKDAEEEREHAMKLVEYQIKRGGVVVFQDIAKPTSSKWSALDALNVALELEQSIHKTLLELHKNATEQNDAHLSDFIEGYYLAEQVDSEYELSNLISQVERAGNEGLGLHIIDKELLSQHQVKE